MLGKMNLHDDNIHAEYFFSDFLNKLYGWNLVDANDEKKNEPGVDLKDEGRKLMVQGSGFMDFREVIHAKHPKDDPDFQPRSYWQVFQHRYGFLPNLSILDLLFCMGPEAVFYL